MFLGRTALIERHSGLYKLREQAELEGLFARAYGRGATLDELMPRLGMVAVALSERNLCLAQIAAVHLRLPDLSDMIARGAMEAEDALIKPQGGELLARGGWDPAEHPRAGVPPNPGWFAPTGGISGSPPLAIAQNEEDERAAEELGDPMTEVRQALWSSAIARLREIDPHNPHLSYFSNPGTAPSQEALDRLNTALGDAVIKRVTNFVVRGGRLIGRQGGNIDVRMLKGGLRAARRAFGYLGTGGSPYKSNYPGEMVRLPGGAGFVGFRTNEEGLPTLDINVPGALRALRLHFQ